jgi:uncharacterized protein (DUF2147 family)
MKALLLAALLAASLPALAADPSIEGRWNTFEGNPPKKRSVIEIARSGDKVTGRITELFLQPGEAAEPNCENCPGADKGRQIRGLAIVHLTATREPGRFEGTVLDPVAGKVYRCVATLEDGGRRLSVRGYVGIPLFGRSETWVRAP